MPHVHPEEAFGSQAFRPVMIYLIGKAEAPKGSMIADVHGSIRNMRNRVPPLSSFARVLRTSAHCVCAGYSPPPASVGPRLRRTGLEI